MLSHYVAAINSHFHELGAKNPVRYFQSNGGLAIGKALTDRAVYAINSGPASAPQAGLFVAAPFKKNNVITVDMGGTSFDITLTKDGVTNINKNIDFLRYRIGVPMIQVETLGAGGGSIGWIDEHGPLAGGPAERGRRSRARPATARAARADGHRRQPRPRLSQSGGSARRPPAARRRQGARRDQERSPIRSAFRSSGRPTACTPSSTTTWSTASAASRWSAATIRAISSWWARAARPPRTSRALAREMGIETVILPKLASGLCAFGQIISDVKYNYMATCPVRLEHAAAVREHQQAVQVDRGRRHSPSRGRRVQARPYRYQPQPRHALCRPGA